MKLTPRQRAALSFPSLGGSSPDHPRYLRRNGTWQSILTFDLYGEDGDDDRVAYWHARATTWPMKPLVDWTTVEQSGVKKVLQRLLKRVGDGDPRVESGSEEPSGSVHFFKKATEAEVARCLQFVAERKAK